MLEEGLIKTGHENIMQIDKLAQAKFQENIRFAQWLYNYVSKKNQVLTGYKAYSKRIEAVKQQSRLFVFRLSDFALRLHF